MFERNTALEGGAIHYNMFRPQIGTSNSFVQNYATYGKDWSSYPAYLELPSEDALNNVASGQKLPNQITFRILDFDRQVINNDNSSVLILQSADSSSSVSGGTQIVAKEGEFVFNDIAFQGPPQTQQAFTITQPFIDPVLVGQAL